MQSHQVRCIVSFIGGFLTICLITLAFFLFLIKPIERPDGVPSGAICKGDYDITWIYEAGRTDSTIRLKIYDYTGKLELDADFENLGINSINEIIYYDSYIIYLDNSRKSHMLESYGGYSKKKEKQEQL